jgi:amino acid permease
MSMIFVGMIFMSVLTLTLKAAVSRWANRVMGILYAVIIFGFWVLGLTLQSAGYEMVWSTAQLVFALLVVWHAWKWTNPETLVPTDEVAMTSASAGVSVPQLMLGRK